VLEQIYLSRRNLLTLLNKLDRNLKNPGESRCTLIKQDTEHPTHPSSIVFRVTAIEDEDYYTDRPPGHSKDAPA